jgi:hypothetical protein
MEVFWFRIGVLSFSAEQAEKVGLRVDTFTAGGCGFECCAVVVVIGNCLTEWHALFDEIRIERRILLRSDGDVPAVNERVEEQFFCVVGSAHRA